MIQIWSVVRNEATHIEEMLRSVLSQTYQDWRLVVSDNFSTDGTADIVRRYCEIDERITLVHPPEPMDGMPHANWLCGQLAESTTADAAMHIGGHDVISADYLLALLKALATYQTAVCTYPHTAYQIDEHSRIVSMWGSCPQTLGVPQPWKLLSMFTNTPHNIPFFGLMRWDAFKATATDMCCTAHDHFVCAELTLHGDIVGVHGPTLLLRRSPGFGNPDVYRQKHLAGVSEAEDLRRQFQWLTSLVNRASTQHQPDFRAAMLAMATLAYITSRVFDVQLLRSEMPVAYAMLAGAVDAGRNLGVEVQQCQ